METSINVPLECRGDTHGARKKNLSRFGGQNPEKFKFENLWNIPQKNLLSQLLSDIPPIEATTVHIFTEHYGIAIGLSNSK